jgi:hypothetical protein
MPDEGIHKDDARSFARLVPAQAVLFKLRERRNKTETPCFHSLEQQPFCFAHCCNVLYFSCGEIHP